MRDNNSIFKIMYERSKMYQLNYYPELKLEPYYDYTMYTLICYDYGVSIAFYIWKIKSYKEHHAQLRNIEMLKND